MRCGPQPGSAVLLLLALSIPPAGAESDDPGPAADPLGGVVLEFVPQQAQAKPGPRFEQAMRDRPVAIRVVDAREVDEPSSIGERRDDDGGMQPLKATADVASFVEGALEELSTQWGLRIETSADLTLAARLRAFNVIESHKSAEALFVAEVRLDLDLVDRGGRVVWRVSSYGDSTYLGEKFSPEACNKALSEAMREMWAAALGHPELPQVWAAPVETREPRPPG
jgi:hypothetical protein